MSDNIWNETGICDQKNLPRSLSEHKKFNIHIRGQISLKTVRTSRIELVLNERRLNISPHNSKVKENREIFKRLIHETCFLGEQELAFHGNDERRTLLILVILSN